MLRIFYRTVLSRNFSFHSSKLSSIQQNVIPIQRLNSSITVNDSSNKIRKLLSVAIVGRPNVGKSTLFNRLTSSKMAIVSDIPGTTRDRKEGKGVVAGMELNVYDTGGLDEGHEMNLSIQKQVEEAVNFADLIFFVVDARVGVTPLDEFFTKWLRKKCIKFSDKSHVLYKKNIVVLANKTEGAVMSNKMNESFKEFLRLGFGEPIPISAAHGDGLADIANILLNTARTLGMSTQTTKVDIRTESLDIEDRTVQLAIMGRPNVGKSTLLNSILGHDRVIVGPTAGLTRDAIHVDWRFAGRVMKLVDTAGLTHLTPDRRLLCGDSKVVSKVERLDPRTLPGVRDMDPEEQPSQFSHRISEMSLVSALNALRFAQVVVMVVEVSQGSFSKIDLQLARKCMQEGRALVVAANKADLLPSGVSSKMYEMSVSEHCQKSLSDFGEVAVVCCVAKDREGINRLLHTVLKVHDSWSRRIDTWVLNSWLKELMVSAPETNHGGRPVRLKYMTQTKARPPTFALFCNVSALPGTFERFLRTRLHADFSLTGVPLRFIVRKTPGLTIKRRPLSSRPGEKTDNSRRHRPTRPVKVVPSSRAGSKSASKEKARGRTSGRSNFVRGGSSARAR